MSKLLLELLVCIINAKPRFPIARHKAQVSTSACDKHHVCTCAASAVECFRDAVRSGLWQRTRSRKCPGKSYVPETLRRDNIQLSWEGKGWPLPARECWILNLQSSVQQASDARRPRFMLHPSQPFRASLTNASLWFCDSKGEEPTKLIARSGGAPVAWQICSTSQSNLIKLACDARRRLFHLRL